MPFESPRFFPAINLLGRRNKPHLRPGLPQKRNKRNDQAQHYQVMPDENSFPPVPPVFWFERTQGGPVAIILRRVRENSCAVQRHYAAHRSASFPNPTAHNCVNYAQVAVKPVAEYFSPLEATRNVNPAPARLRAAIISGALRYVRYISAIFYG
jgi:hypothetical protein